MRGLVQRAKCGAALIVVLLLQPVVVSLCAAACGREASGAGREEPAEAGTHCGGEENGSDADPRPCGGHTKVHSSMGVAPRKASLSAGSEITALLRSPTCSERLEILYSLARSFPVSYPSHAPPGGSVLRL